MYKEKIDRYIPFLLIFFSLFVICAAIPIFHLRGMYPQVDSQIIFLYVISGIVYFYLSIKLFYSKIDISKFFNYLVFIPFVIGIISLISSFINPLPLRSFYGSLQVGQGAFWYFGLSALILLGTNVVNNKKQRINFLIILVCITITASFFTAFPNWKGINISFFGYRDYLAFFGSFIFIVLTTVTRNLFIVMLSYFLLGLYLIFLENNAALLCWFSTLAGGVFYYLINIFNKIKFFKTFQKIFFSSAAFTTYIILVSLLILLSSFIFWPGEETLPNYLQETSLSSLVVRGKIIEVCMHGFENFKTILLGNGWGKIDDVLLSNMNVWQFDQLRVGFNLHFHTHNEIFEHLISLGVFGCILFLLYIYFIFKESESNNINNKLAWLLTFKISCFWFFWAGTLPLLALACATTTNATGTNNLLNSKIYIRYFGAWTKKNKKYFRPFFVAIFLLISGFLFFAGYFGYNSTLIYQKASYMKIMNFTKSNNDYLENCDQYYNDFGNGGIFLVKFLDSYSNYFLLELDKIEEESEKVFETVSCIANKLVFSNSSTKSLLTASLQLEAKLLIREKSLNGNLIDLDKFKKNNYARWHKKALMVDEKLPRREELLMPFLSFALETKNTEDAFHLCNLRERKRIAGFCNLVIANHILENEKVSKNEVRKAVLFLKKAIKEGVLNERVYGWWLEKEINENAEGFNFNGIPMAADIIFQVNDKQAQELIDLVGKF